MFAPFENDGRPTQGHSSGRDPDPAVSRVTAPLLSPPIERWSRPSKCAPAVLLLSHRDWLDVAERAQDAEGSLELRALRHGLAPTEPSQRELSAAVREGNWAEALAVARGCARSLDAPLDEKLRDAPESVKTRYDAIRARCRRAP